MINELILVLVLEFKESQDHRALQEFELLLYEAACNYLTMGLRNETITNGQGDYT